MKIYRIVYTYENTSGEHAEIYYTRADSKEDAEDKFKSEYPEYKIESIREI